MPAARPGTACSVRNQLSVLPLRKPGPPPRRSAVRWPRRSPKPSRVSRGKFASSPPACSARPNGAAAIQQSIARIQEASQAPTLSPQDYRTLFEVMAQEIAANGLAGAQTLTNIVKRAESLGIEIRRDDVRFVLDVVSEADPWFEQGASPNLFAWRFRNFVVARCRGQGLNLSADELDLIEAWFAAPTAAAGRRRPAQGGYAPGAPAAAGHGRLRSRAGCAAGPRPGAGRSLVERRRRPPAVRSSSDRHRR